MSTRLLFYENVKSVAANRHGDLSVKVGTDYSFAGGTNSVPLTATEFNAAAAEYSIVFVGSEENTLPVVLLGAQERENAYVGVDGRWDANYVPAFVRRYPFVFSLTEDEKTFTLCIDEDFSGCNREGRGERLFDTDGERTGYLQQVLNFQTEYQAQFQRTKMFCKRLVDLELLESIQAQIRVGAGEPRVLTGIRAVSLTKVKELDQEALTQMVRADELELIYLHLHSLVNLRRFGEQFAPEEAPAVQDPQPEEIDATPDVDRPDRTH